MDCHGHGSAMRRQEFEHIADVTRTISTPEFYISVQYWINSIVHSKLMTMIAYNSSDPPMHLHDNFTSREARAGMVNYLTQTYVLNAFYQRHMEGMADGIYRLKDLGPDAYYESDLHARYAVILSKNEDSGFVADGWPAGLDEVDIAISLPHHTTVEIGLYNPKREGGIKDYLWPA